jgi:hypothetical protein
VRTILLFANGQEWISISRFKKKNGKPRRVPLCVTIGEDVLRMMDVLGVNKSEAVHRALRETCIIELMKGGFSRELAEEEITREWKRYLIQQMQEVVLE